MLTELRGGLFLVMSLVFFLFIIAVLTLGTIMRPGRWSERPKSVS
jgi:hypothetical protein